MTKLPIRSSRAWLTYFRKNALSVLSDDFKPPASASLPFAIRAAVASSLPAWQLGETSDGHHLRAAARHFSVKENDPLFPEAIDAFIREEQRHGAALGAWLDTAGIPRVTHDTGDSMFRLCRYAIPHYVAWATVVVMVESLAEIYYAAVRRGVPCPRLQSECDRILFDEVRHIQFQCEHLAVTRRHLPRWLRSLVGAGESAFYLLVCTAVWLAHGRLLRVAGMTRRKFFTLARAKFRFAQNLMNPDRYSFESHAPNPTDRTPFRSRATEPFVLADRR